jgi:hypothetical protein
VVSVTLLWLRTCVHYTRQLVSPGEHALFQPLLSPVDTITGFEGVLLCLTSYEVRHQLR